VATKGLLNGGGAATSKGGEVSRKAVSVCGGEAAADSCVVFDAGPLKGTAVVSVSATAGACLAFLVSRYLARPVVEAKVAGEGGRGSCCSCQPTDCTQHSGSCTVWLADGELPNSPCQ
jgi:hypothetical protein